MKESVADKAKSQDDGVESGACKPRTSYNASSQSPTDCGHCDVHFNARRERSVAPSSIMAPACRGCAGSSHETDETSVHPHPHPLRPVAPRGSIRSAGQCISVWWCWCWRWRWRSLPTVHQVRIIALHHQQLRMSRALTRLTGRQGEMITRAHCALAASGPAWTANCQRIAWLSSWAWVSPACTLHTAHCKLLPVCHCCKHPSPLTSPASSATAHAAEKRPDCIAAAVTYYSGDAYPSPGALSAPFRCSTHRKLAQQQASAPSTYR